MKSLKLTPVLAMIMAVLFSFAACKKDKNDGPDGGGSSYKFNNASYKITNANEKHLGGDIFLEFTAANPGDALQIAFANTNTLPEGTLTFNPDRNVGYNPQTNFWASSVGIGGVSTEITGGTVNITKNGDGYKITFNATTANGAVTGEYSGTPQVTN